MAFTSPKMTLRVWDQLSDPYDHNQLADNWAKVDLHDHTPGRGVQVPTEGIADGAITPIKLAATIDPSALYTTYAPVLTGEGTAGATLAAGTYVFDAGTLVAPTAGSARGVMYVDPADWVASGRSTKFRLKTSCLTNTQAASGITFTLGLYPVTAVAGTAGIASITLGTVVTGSTVAYATPGTGTMQHLETTDFDVTVGYYVLGVSTSGSTAVSSFTSFRSALQVRRV